MVTNKPDITALIDAVESGYLNEKILTKAIANRSDAAAAKVGDNLTDWVIGLSVVVLGVTVSVSKIVEQINTMQIAQQQTASSIDANGTSSSSITNSSSAYDALAKAFEAEAGKPYLPRAGEVPGPYCSFFMWSVFDKFGWRIPTTKQPIDNGLRGQNPGRGLAASWGADMANGGVNRDASKARRGQVVLFTGTYGNFGAGAITHVGFIVEDAAPGKPAVMVDKGSSQIVARRSITAPGGQFVASFFPIIPSSIAANYVSKSTSQPGKFSPSTGFIKPIDAQPGSPFGMRKHPILGYLRPHNGQDFGASTGTPFKATASGVVLRAGDMGQCGNGVVIAHGGGYESTYCHASSLSVSAGQNVSQGQVIGQVGSTGLSTGPHLHFGMKQNGQWINPMGVIR